MKRVMCIPNYSEGRDLKKVEKITECFRAKENIKLIDYQPDADHNRLVVEVIGEPEAVIDAVLESVKVATEVIDMSKHKGAHPRMGAVDVVPFVPVTECTTEECVEYAKRVGKAIGDMGIPVYLYEDAASTPARKNLAKVRKGQYEGFFDKIKEDEWKPDFGPQEMNEKSGATAVAARFQLVALNVNLDTLEMVKSEAKRYGVTVVNTELIGLLPLQALVDSAAYYMQIDGLKQEQVLETLLIEE